MIRRFGLIGYPLGHSFSKKYFSEKFKKEHISNASYDLFEIDDIKKAKEIFNIPDLRGVNVTIPYKHDIMNYLDDLDDSAKKVGAVNVVRINQEGKKTGFNSDYFGFKLSLETWIKDLRTLKALVLGTGGAAKAVLATLNDLQIPFLKVSRDITKGDITYEQLKEEVSLIRENKLIINTTPLGMSPKIDVCPDLPYEEMNVGHYLYDLVYNPLETLFMQKGMIHGAKAKNGLEMLELQAEKSWEIWNS